MITVHDYLWNEIKHLKQLFEINWVLTVMVLHNAYVKIIKPPYLIKIYKK